jgi:hypothetical protein
MDENKTIKSSFVRGLWGFYNPTGKRSCNRRPKLDNDIKLAAKIKIKMPLMNYVFGEDNYKYLLDLGFSARLLDKRPVAWDLETQQYRHKLEVLKEGLVDFDEIVLLDWDTIPIIEIPSNFWETLRKKAPFQAILRTYKRKKVTWRKDGIDIRKVPCAAFVYLNDKKIADELISIWEKMEWQWSEEVVFAKYLDNISGGWQGTDYHLEHFEPDFFTLYNEQSWIRDKLKWKTIVFEHHRCHSIGRMLNSINRREASEIKKIGKATIIDNKILTEK